MKSELVFVFTVVAVAASLNLGGANAVAPFQQEQLIDQLRAEGNQPAYEHEEDAEAGGDPQLLIDRDPVLLLDLLSRIRSRMARPIENSKRGIDFGLGRGFSGSQAAKHFMGMAAASFSGGPGRKRKRSEALQAY